MKVTKSKLENDLKLIVREQFGTDIHVEDINSDTHIIDTFGADILDMVELCMSCESYLDDTIQEEDWDKVTTFGSLVSLMESKVTIIGD